MLEHQKLVIENVADNSSLFKKELFKSMAWLNSHELTQFRKWVRDTFWNTHRDIIQEVLYTSYVSC